MGLTVTKESIDLGLVTSNAEAMVGFYRDTLGLKYEGELAMPGGMVMHRLLCGTTVIKIVVPPKAPAAVSPPGGIGGATGIRYFTISVTDLEGITSVCEQAGAKVVMGVRDVRPGIRISMVEDPDGNWVEFLHAS